MAMKDDWQTGDIVTAAHLNAIADEVNATQSEADGLTGVIDTFTATGLALASATDAAAAREVIGALQGFDVVSYGATGDGVTDDTTAIHAARDAAGVGGTVFFPAGTYLVSGLTASVASQTWELVSHATVKAKVGATKILHVTADGVTVTGGVFDGVNGTAHNGAQNGLEVGGDNVTVRDVTVINSPLYGISAYNCDNTTIHHCIVRNSYGAGIWAQNSAAAPSDMYDVSITDCLVENSDGGDFSSGIGTYGAVATQRVHRIKICRNTVRLPYDQADQNTGCVGVVHGTDFVVSDNILKGGYISISCHNAVNGVVSGNTVRGFKYIGIELPAGAEKVTVSGNTVDPDGTTGHESGIQSSDGTINDLTVTGNVIRNFTEDNSMMIRFGTNTTAVNRASITGNVLTSGGDVYKAIFFWGAVSDTAITGNVIDGVGSTNSVGLEFGGAIDGISITGNHFSNLDLAAVMFGTGSAVTQDYVRVAGNGYVNCGSILLDSNYGSGASALGSNVFAAERVAVPPSAGAAGSIGSWAADSSYAYFCTATNTWVRGALATW